MERVLLVEMQDTENKDLQKTITYANPSASDADLYKFTTDMVGLTTNTHVCTKKVDTTVLVGD